MSVPPGSKGQLSGSKRTLLDRLRNAAGSSSGQIPVSTETRLVSHTQRQLWLLEQSFEQEGPFPYNQSFSIALRGELDAAVLERAVNEIVARHAVLRTSFEMRDDHLVAHVERERLITVRVLELDRRGDEDMDVIVERLAWQEARKRFDLTRGSLIRGTLMRFSPVEHSLLLTVHHIAIDGVSLGILLDELAEIYEALRASRLSLAPLRIQYSDFAMWQVARLTPERLSNHVEFWKKELADELPLLDLPLDNARPSTRSFRGAREELRIGAETLQRLVEVGARHDATLFMTLLAAYKALLSRYCGQDEVIVGAPSAGRAHPDVNHLIGCFINQVPYRTWVDGRAPFSELLRQVARTAQRVLAHEDLPFDMLVSALAAPRVRNQNPVFQTLFGLQEVVAPRVVAGLELCDITMHNAGTAKFDLEVNVLQEPSGLIARIDYDTDVIERSTARRLLRAYVRTLECVSQDPSVPVNRLPLVDDAERRRTLVDWNQTQAPYPEDVCVHELFSAQAARTPDRIALVCEDAQLTYRELDERSNQLARHLRSHGVGPEVLVGLYLERSLEMIVGLLGVLKAGGAYVPLDPTYPKERISYALNETGMTMLLTLARLSDGLPDELPRHVLHLDRDWGQIARMSRAPLGRYSRPDELIYLMYTSGSSGTPKGVMLEHRGVTNRVVAMQRAYFAHDDIVLQKTPYTFDVAVNETLCPLIVGARLIMARPEGHRDPTYLKEVIQRECVSVTEFVPSMLQLLLAEPGVEDACHSLRLVISSGEALSRDLQDTYFAKVKGELHNLYGPTEAGEVTAWPCKRDVALNTTGVPLGRPIANFQVYILDPDGQPVPVGARGEVFICGVGVARGYFHRPGLTAERFVPNPFGEPGTRLYRTGDIARYREDGTIEYLGRADFQVKLRGFRIELGEIESVLKQHGGVRDCVVVARDDRPGDKRLVAYVAGEPDAVSEQELRTAVKQRLPDFMIPSAFVLLDALPYTKTGKVDRNKLPEPEVFRAQHSQLEEIMTPTERKLLGIWSDVLGVRGISVDDDFFELGGNSLLVVQVATRIRQDFAIDVPQQVLFEAPTVRLLATRVDALATRMRELLSNIPQTDEQVRHARAILEDPLASAAAKIGAQRFLEALERD